MGRLTTHVLDVARGRAAEGIGLRLFSLGHPIPLADTATNADGRCEAPLLHGQALRAGRYELVFAAGVYLARHHAPRADPPFLDEIVHRFGIAAPDEHYHVALLLSPFSYTIYRGS